MLDAEAGQTTGNELLEPELAAERSSRRRVVAIVLGLVVVDVLWLIFIARGLYGLLAA